MKQVLVTTVLRKWNKQWRILSHHGVAVDEDPFLSNRKAVAPGSRVNYGFHTKVNKMTSNLKSGKQNI